MSDILTRCPECGELPIIGIDALSGKPRVACMNICCRNMQSFTDDKVGEAMAQWELWAYKKTYENR